VQEQQEVVVLQTNMTKKQVYSNLPRGTKHSSSTFGLSVEAPTTTTTRGIAVAIPVAVVAAAATATQKKTRLTAAAPQLPA
jgi:hypothetical protein